MDIYFDRSTPDDGYSPCCSMAYTLHLQKLVKYYIFIFFTYFTYFFGGCGARAQSCNYNHDGCYYYIYLK